ncbi:hypothetical protein B0H12DRAFT_1243173 [Mycena haematopus]|nr:hypothetical protein B0H12DRAFT_1243173 [Mycena haematopus]
MALDLPIKTDLKPKKFINRTGTQVATQESMSLTFESDIFGRVSRTLPPRPKNFAVEKWALLRNFLKVLKRAVRKHEVIFPVSVTTGARFVESHALVALLTQPQETELTSNEAALHLEGHKPHLNSSVDLAGTIIELSARHADGAAALPEKWDVGLEREKRGYLVPRLEFAAAPYLALLRLYDLLVYFVDDGARGRWVMLFYFLFFASSPTHTLATARSAPPFPPLTRSLTLRSGISQIVPVVLDDLFCSLPLPHMPARTGRLLPRPQYEKSQDLRNSKLGTDLHIRDCSGTDPNWIWNIGFSVTALPATSENDQIGTTSCGATSSQSSKYQTAWIECVSCLWAPPSVGTIGGTERHEIAWCTHSGRGTRTIPNGGVHFARSAASPTISPSSISPTPAPAPTPSTRYHHTRIKSLHLSHSANPPSHFGARGTNTLRSACSQTNAQSTPCY